MSLALTDAAPMLRVVVPDSAFGSVTATALPLAVGRFVAQAIGPAGYRADELPGEAMLAHALVTYLAVVENGGHAHFVATTGYPPPLRARLAAMLALLGQDDHARIVAELERFALEQPARFAACAGDPDAIDPYFDELDLHYLGLPPGQLVSALAAWLRTRNWIEVLPDRACRDLAGAVLPPHPRLAGAPRTSH